MYLQWNDRSLCETGFSLTRQGEQFTNVYAVQSSVLCNVTHAPTLVFDDLLTAQTQGKATVGSYQKYCVQAVNPIGCNVDGTYSSDPTMGCTTLQINWEAALTGKVTGEFKTGYAPVPGVTFTWQFADYPQISGMGTTNADGNFVQMDANPLIDIQVSWSSFSHTYSLMILSTYLLC